MAWHKNVFSLSLSAGNCTLNGIMLFPMIHLLWYFVCTVQNFVPSFFISFCFWWMHEIEANKELIKNFNGNDKYMWLWCLELRCVALPFALVMSCMHVESSSQITIIIITSHTHVRSNSRQPLAFLSLWLNFLWNFFFFFLSLSLLFVLRTFPFSMKPQIKCVMFWTDFVYVENSNWILIYVFQIVLLSYGHTNILCIYKAVFLCGGCRDVIFDIYMLFLKGLVSMKRWFIHWQTMAARSFAEWVSHAFNL